MNKKIMIDPVKLYYECMNKGQTEEETKLELCNKFIEDISKLKGADLYPHLKETKLVKESGTLEVTLSFPLSKLHPLN